MSEKVNLFFFPEIEEGEDEDEVKSKLASTLRVDESKVESWFASGKPTIILKGVEDATAMKYVDAIRGCGGKCDIQEVGADEWSLEQMTQADIRDLFICPSCEYEEQMERGGKMEQCPKCGLVIAKWEEKMREEAEKEKIRRRLMRDARLRGDRDEELEKKRNELERLRKLELEIMAELGIKPPSVLWQFFEKYTISVSFAVTCLIVMATGIAFRYADMYLEEMAHKELVAEPASEEIQQIAPIMSAAIGLQQNGNQQVVTEIADVADVIRGHNDARKAIVDAAQQMMKGADASAFIAKAGQMALPKMTAQLSEGEVAPAPVNVDTIGGVSGLTGLTSFPPQALNQISPPLMEHGHENVLSVLSEKKVIPDPIDPDAPDVVVEAIDELDGSKLIDLMNTLAQDQEWDQYLLDHVEFYLEAGKFDEASALVDRIKNPVIRIEALGSVGVAYMADERPNEIKLIKATVRLDLDRISDVNTRAMVLLNLGKRLGDAGVQGEPGFSLDLVEAMASDATNPLDRSSLYARVAVALTEEGNHALAKRNFAKAQNTAGQMKDLSSRISAFARIAMRYYDARNTTLANEILQEASVLAATELPPTERSVAFGEIAMAQGYLGDFVGARLSINNAGKAIGKQQLIAKLAESLIGLGRYYEALALMEELENELEYNRLELRLSSRMIHENRTREALNRLETGSPRATRIYDLSERGLILSQYARLYMRLGRDSQAQILFDEALAISDQLQGRKSQVNRGIVALDWARSLRIGKAKEVLRDVVDATVHDPIDNEVMATKRIIENLLPSDLVGTPASG
ncbi:MAG: hypothetical protein O2780_10075 [Proteobacteria bacterium]|nr:hypothetical protein [Pseudomonadota bacterium]